MILVATMCFMVGWLAMCQLPAMTRYRADSYSDPAASRLTWACARLACFRPQNTSGPSHKVQGAKREALLSFRFYCFVRRWCELLPACLRCRTLWDDVVPRVSVWLQERTVWSEGETNGDECRSSQNRWIELVEEWVVLVVPMRTVLHKEQETHYSECQDYDRERCCSTVGS